MPFGGSKDKHFSCFHMSCQTGLIQCTKGTKIRTYCKELCSYKVLLTRVSASLTPDVNLSDISWSSCFSDQNFGRPYKFLIKKDNYHPKPSLLCCMKNFSRIWAEFWVGLSTIKLCSWLQLFYWTKRIHILTEWDLSTLLYLIEILKFT